MGINTLLNPHRFTHNPSSLVRYRVQNLAQEDQTT
jgi:hypothetical protein